MLSRLFRDTVPNGSILLTRGSIVVTNYMLNFNNFTTARAVLDLSVVV